MFSEFLVLCAGSLNAVNTGYSQIADWGIGGCQAATSQCTTVLDEKTTAKTQLNIPTSNIALDLEGEGIGTFTSIPADFLAANQQEGPSRAIAKPHFLRLHQLNLTLALLMVPLLNWGGLTACKPDSCQVTTPDQDQTLDLGVQNPMNIDMVSATASTPVTIKGVVQSGLVYSNDILKVTVNFQNNTLVNAPAKSINISFLSNGVVKQTVAVTQPAVAAGQLVQQVFSLKSAVFASHRIAVFDPAVYTVSIPGAYQPLSIKVVASIIWVPQGPTVSKDSAGNIIITTVLQNVGTVDTSHATILKWFGETTPTPNYPTSNLPILQVEGRHSQLLWSFHRLILML